MFRKRLTVALGTLACAALLQGGVSLWALQAAGDKVYRGRVASDVLAGFLELYGTKQRLRAWLSQSLLGAPVAPQLREQLQSEMAATLDRLDAMAVLAAELDGDRGALQAEHRQRQEDLRVLHQSLDELRIAMASVQPQPPNDSSVALWSEITRVFDVSQGRDLRSLLDRNIAREKAAVARDRAAADSSLALVRTLALGAATSLALAAALLALYFARALRQPLEELSTGVEALQRGELQHRIPAHRHDEFSRFAQRVNAMAGEIAHHREREVEARHRLEDLVQARTAELQDALQTLRQLEARRRQLFADISHELRTPTTVIRGEADIALRGQDKPAGYYQGAMQRIVGAAQQLGGVIDDLLTMARTDIDTLALHREPLSVAAPLQEAVEQAQTLGLEHRVQVEYTASAEDWRLLGDAQRLRQLFTLLLHNAVRYSHFAGVVQVQASCVADASGAALWQLHVIDRGIGISADDLPRVFERNFRGENARLHRTDGSGLGLGLPIAAMLTRAHGGHIEIDSQPGQGTKVSLRLPLLVEPVYEHTDR
ncbi:signal transduction histidine kinase [Rhodoferax ferrireducens]|uniref:histidine kinase n=1 Tax=Rhodoferax ferrireducens TaxID=192843 RepID=A0ABU2CFM5_9BURK|nr:ATP-binding protein [Rhodoferax ferrireducens]MDR7380091.1 signal transduction histidine kinase [Rhodoferax ferrireducens]